MKKISIDNNALGQAIIDTLNEGKKASITVKGNSMRPFFRDGKTVVVITKKNEYKKGDIIFFRYQQLFKLHRIKSIKDHHIIACGDNLMQKEIIEKQDVIGYVESYQNKGKVTQTSSLFYKVKVCVWLLIKPLILMLVSR